ncbi:LacI family DNA-binding transcriptional regulator [Sphingomonas sp.]|jgi:LacI family transcriptional regulator|uniref:LacI family DNA-binding transcriptional regulator n=1 Tax=Sphingomonas sp. TaxID=28214 RepID=UPI002EDAB5B4
MRDVALRAGVSQMTVSFVVNGTKNVSSGTHHLVREAIEALGYVPNRAARSLASAEEMRIGLLHSNVPNAFLSELLTGTLNAASRLGLQIHLEKFDPGRPDLLVASIERLAAAGANALLLPPPVGEHAAVSPLWRACDMPAVAVAPGASLSGIAAVRNDERQAACDMVSLIFDHGHRRIGIITGPPSHSASQARLDGYLAAHAERGLTADPSLAVPGSFDFTSGIDGAATLLDSADPPTAIFASNDAMASGVIALAHRRRLDLPGDLSVAGFDDTPIATQVWPTLTTVGRDVTAMAEKGVEMLAAIRRSHTSGGGCPIEDHIAEYRLIRRDSVGPPRR